MSETPADTRAKILRAAAEAFARNGYYATSVRAIAEQVGLTKTAVLYHFPEKSDLLVELARPLLDDLEAVMRSAVGAGSRARWAVIEGVLDVFLKYKNLLGVNLHDLSFAAAQPAFERFRDAMLLGNTLVAGPKPSLAARVRAAQALAMIGDPVILFADTPQDQLRKVILEGVRRLLSDRASAAPAHTTSEPRRRKRGRPPAVGDDTIERARRMYEEGNNAEQIAAELGVSRATVYRYLAAREL